MNSYQRWIDVPWREMPSWMRGLAIVIVIVVAGVLDHVIGGGTGFLVGLVAALVLAILIPVGWRVLQD